MSNPYLYCLHQHAQQALRTMIQNPYEGLSDHDYYMFLSAGLRAIYQSLDKSEAIDSKADEQKRLVMDMDMARSILADCINNYPPTKEKMLQASALIALWFPERGEL